MSIVKLPEMPALQSDGPPRPARSSAAALHVRPRHASSRIGPALDVAWTLLALVLIGTGIVALRFLLVLARGAIGH
jgi:hypothetical protein